MNPDFNDAESESSDNPEFDQDAKIYIYGDEGMDMIFGADRINYQYLFGGKGDDII